MSTARTRREAPGRYLHLASGVEIVFVPSSGGGYRSAWITRDAGDPRVTFDAYATKAEAVADLDRKAVPMRNKTIAEMTPAERDAAIKRAARRFQAELDATAERLAEVLDADDSES